MEGGVEDAVHGCVFIVLGLADIRHSSSSSKISTLKGASLLTSYASQVILRLPLPRVNTPSRAMKACGILHKKEY